MKGYIYLYNSYVDAYDISVNTHNITDLYNLSVAIYNSTDIQWVPCNCIGSVQADYCSISRSIPLHDKG